MTCFIFVNVIMQMFVKTFLHNASIFLYTWVYIWIVYKFVLKRKIKENGINNLKPSNKLNNLFLPMTVFR